MRIIDDNKYYELIKPIIKNSKDYFLEEFLSKYISHYISNLYTSNLLEKTNLNNIINSALNILHNIKITDCNINEISNILRRNYHLKIINDNPIIVNEE